MYRAIRALGLAAVMMTAAWSWGDVCLPAIWSDTPAFGAEGATGGYTAPSYLGIDARDISSDRVAALKLKDEHGVEITMVDQDAPAGKAGLKEHDVILDVNGQRLESMEQLRRMIKETPPGRSITLNISRDGQPMTLKATLADRRKMIAMSPTAPIPPVPPVAPVPPNAMSGLPGMSFDIPEIHMRSTWAGMTVETLSPQLGEYFGVRNGEGVLVNSVAKGSVADKAGLRAGDVIVRVDRERISGRADWRAAMRRHRSGKVTFGVYRDRREQSITMVLPADSGDESLRIDMDDLDFDALNREMQRLKPELMQASAEAVRLSSAEVQKAMREARVEMEREIRHMRRDLEQQRKDAEKARKDAEKNNSVQ